MNIQYAIIHQMYYSEYQGNFIFGRTRMEVILKALLIINQNKLI